jgi:hypothetical protein
VDKANEIIRCAEQAAQQLTMDSNRLQEFSFFSVQ